MYKNQINVIIPSIQEVLHNEWMKPRIKNIFRNIMMHFKYCEFEIYDLILEMMNSQPFSEINHEKDYTIDIESEEKKNSVANRV